MAARDGQLVPGDRLLFVNDVSLENATLDEAVQALKGAPIGIVRIGVTKSLPITDSPVRVKLMPANSLVSLPVPAHFCVYHAVHYKFWVLAVLSPILRVFDISPL